MSERSGQSQAAPADASAGPRRRAELKARAGRQPGKAALPRVLAVRFGALGDVALTTGVLAWLRANRGLTFHMLTRDRFAPLFDHHPAVERVEGLPEDQMRGLAFLATARRLVDDYQGGPGRRVHPGNTALLDLHGNLRTRLIKNLWSGLAMTYPKFALWRRLYRLTGLALAERRLLALNTPQRYSLAIEDEAPPAEALVPRLYLSAAERTWAAERLADWPGGDRDAQSKRAAAGLVALHPYATHALKAWPESRWRALTGLLDAAGLGWFVVGRAERPLFPDDPRDLTNRTDLRRTIALLGQAAVLVTGDSGPMHLAAGVDVPVVALFGPTSRAWGFYPAGARDVVLELPLPCRPCALHGQGRCARGGACLADIAPETVLAAALRSLPR